MPISSSLRSLNGKGPTIRGAATPLRPINQKVGLGTGRGLATARTRTDNSQRIGSIYQASAARRQADGN